MRLRADVNYRTARRTLYAAHMTLAAQAWEGGQVGRVRELLAPHGPEPGEEDLRGFEWYHLWRLSHAEHLTISRHRRWVRSLAWSRDGRRLVTGSYDNTVRVWDGLTGWEERVFTGHTAAVHRVAFHRDGRRVLSAGDDGSVRLWDLDRGAHRVLTRHPAKVWAVGFSPSGALVASADVAGGLRVHDLNTGRALEGLPAQVKPANALVFSPGGRWLALGCDGGVVCLVDLPNRGLRRQQVFADGTPVLSVAFAPGGALACGGRAGRIRLWDHQGGKPVRELNGHTGAVWGLDFTPAGDLLVSSSWDHTVKVWEVATGTLRETLLGHVEAVKYAAFCPTDPSRLATASRDGTVKLWNLPARQQPRSWPCPSPQRVAAGGGRLLVCGGGRVQAWDLAKGSLAALPPTLAAALSAATAVAVRPDARCIAVGDRVGSVRLLDARTGVEFAGRSAHSRAVDALSWSPDGSTLLTAAAAERSARLWEVSAGAGCWGLHPSGSVRGAGPVRAAAFGRGRIALLVSAEGGVGSAAAVATRGKVDEPKGRDGRVVLWDRQSGRLTELTGDGQDVAALAFSPDGRTLALAETRRQGDHVFGVVSLWTAGAGTPRELGRYQAGFQALAFSPDGRTLVAGDRSGRLHFWCPQTGEVKGGLPAGAPVQALVFGPGGHTLTAVGAGTAFVRIWRAATDDEARAYRERHALGS
jgi:WD40 repeat protein